MMVEKNDESNTMLNIKRAVVLGATGGMGSALVEELLNKRIEVIAFARSAEKLNALQNRMKKMKRKNVKNKRLKSSKLAHLNRKGDSCRTFFTPGNSNQF